MSGGLEVELWQMGGLGFEEGIGERGRVVGVGERAVENEGLDELVAGTFEGGLDDGFDDVAAGGEGGC